jgi:hypothetical protein
MQQRQLRLALLQVDPTPTPTRVAQKAPLLQWPPTPGIVRDSAQPVPVVVKVPSDDDSPKSRVKEEPNDKPFDFAAPVVEDEASRNQRIHGHWAGAMPKWLPMLARIHPRNVVRGQCTECSHVGELMGTEGCPGGCCPHCWRTFIKERYGYVEGEDEADEQQTVSDTASSAAAAAPQPTQPQVPTAAKSAPPKPFGLPVRARGRSRTPPPRSAARSRAAAEHTVQAAPVAEVPARPRVTSFSPKKRAVKTEPAGDKCPNSWCNRPGGEYTGGHCCKFCQEWLRDKTKLEALQAAWLPVATEFTKNRRQKLNSGTICHCNSCDLREVAAGRDPWPT